jgi:hypothetical protein
MYSETGRKCGIHLKALKRELFSQFFGAFAA